MSRIAGFVKLNTFIEQGVTNIAATGGQTEIWNANPQGNYVFARVKKHASQDGGSTPIAYLSYDSAETAPDATNSIPIYDGDELQIFPEEIRGASIASADGNQPTLHYVLWQIQ